MITVSLWVLLVASHLGGAAGVIWRARAPRRAARRRLRRSIRKYRELRRRP